MDFSRNLLWILLASVSMVCGNLTPLLGELSVCPGISLSSCGPDIHYPFDDVLNYKEMCGRPKPLTAYRNGWTSPLFSNLLSQYTDDGYEDRIRRLDGISGSALYLTGNEAGPIYTVIDDVSCKPSEETCPFGFTVAFWVKPFVDRQTSENNILLNPFGRYKRSTRAKFTTRKRINTLLSLVYGDGGSLGELTVKTKSFKRSRRSKDTVCFTMKYPQAIKKKKTIMTYMFRHQVKLQKSLIPNDMWTHVIIRWDSRERKDERLVIYINQQQVYGRLDTGRRAVRKSRSYREPSKKKLTIYIGGTGAHTSSVAHLAMDELSIWKKPIPDNEIKFLPIYPGCPHCWMQYKGRCFKAFEDKTTYLEAENTCMRYGASLLTDERNPNHHFLMGHIYSQKKVKSMWVGPQLNFATFALNVNNLLSSHDSTKAETSRINIEDYYLPIGAELPRDDPNVMTLDFSENYDSTSPNMDYVLDDYSASLYLNETIQPDACYINTLRPPLFHSIAKQNCQSLNSAVCTYDINECTLGSHKCGRNKCINKPSGYTCICPKGAKWNGEQCQGTRSREDYCRLVETFSKLSPNGFCKHKHFKMICPEKCL